MTASIQDFHPKSKRGAGKWRAETEKIASREAAGEKKQAAKQETGSLEEQKQSSESDTIEQLQKYKGLLDAGVITEEEFAAKKKQLLGI